MFQKIRELAIDETLLSWEEICHVASKFPSLNSIFSSANQLSSLSFIPNAPFTSTLVSIHMEFNDFTSIAELAPLAAITSLRNVHLKGNRIATITPTSSPDDVPIFTPNLHYLDVSYNQISSWSFVDSLPTSFPGLTSIRFAHNPIYDNPDLDNQDTSAATTTKAASSTEEAYMLLLARLPPTLKIINFSTITPADRSNAEMFYLSRIARQLAAAPESDAPQILACHRRWAELCELYGEPTVVRRKETNPNFLEARLIGVEFHLAGETMRAQQQHHQQLQQQRVAAVLDTRMAKIPKAFDIYAVKGIAGKLFGLSPMQVKLIWETGEWDPVAGFDEEEDGDDSEEEEDEEEPAEENQAQSQAGKGTGRWVKRETELKDSPRQFGYCVDGLEVKIRVEII